MRDAELGDAINRARRRSGAAGNEGTAGMG